MITQGTTVKHGSPGYENVETIKDITDRGDKKLITFESGFTTVMDSDDIQELLDKGRINVWLKRKELIELVRLTNQ